MRRGTFQFEIEANGDLADDAQNVEALRRLWLDRSSIDGDDLGPGDAGDFDNGAWHVACHLVAAGGVRRAPTGELLWLELSHDGAKDEYFASVTGRAADRVATYRIDSADGRQVLAGSQLLGFVEGNSVGHVSFRGANDPPDRFNLWTRQQFDKPVDSQEDGGKVWEHWCTVRDIRPSHRIGSSVLKAYATLVAALGERFVTAVARGRRDYGHPKQLCAMVQAGFVSEQAATWDVTPQPIPASAEQRLLEARPADELEACGLLAWGSEPRYYMLKRRIGSWSAASSVRADLAAWRKR